MKKCPVCKKIMSPSRPCSHCGYKAEEEIDPKIVLDIIETKEVIMPDFMDSAKSFDFIYEEYLEYKSNYSVYTLTEKEFNTLTSYFTRKY